MRGLWNVTSGVAWRTGKNALTNPQEMFQIHFTLTADARAALAAACGPGGTGLLAIYVDGKFWGAAYFQAKAAFEPIAGHGTAAARGVWHVPIRRRRRLRGSATARARIGP